MNTPTATTDQTVALTTEVKSLTAAGAQVALNAAEQAAIAKGLLLSFAVVDAAGHLLAFRRMDGAVLISINAAMDKARATALTKAPTKLFQDLVQGAGMQGLMALEGGYPVEGGVPLVIDGMIVGAIGASGAAAEDDALAAQAGADALAAPAAR